MKQLPLELWAEILHFRLKAMGRDVKIKACQKLDTVLKNRTIIDLRHNVLLRQQMYQQKLIHSNSSTLSVHWVIFYSSYTHAVLTFDSLIEVYYIRYCSGEPGQWHEAPRTHVRLWKSRYGKNYISSKEHRRRCDKIRLLRELPFFRCPVE